MKRAFALFLATVLSAPMIAQAGPRADLQGFWAGGVQQGRGRITVEAKIVDARAKIDLQIRYWGKQRLSLQCQFYSALDGAGSGPVYLNSGRSDGACPTSGAFAFKRLSPSQIEIRTPPIGGQSAFRLNETMRPLQASEIARLPAGFKILGLTVGMTRTAVEKALAQQGYRQSRVSPFASRAGNWRAEMVEYSAETASDASGANDGADTLTIGYSLAAPIAPDGRQIALVIHRQVTPAQDRPLQAIALRNAIKARYGEPSVSSDRSGFMNFKYLANGRGALIRGKQAERAFCVKGARSGVQLGFYPSGWRGGSELKSHCGSKLEVYAAIDQRLGTVRTYSQSLSSVDLATTDFWRKLAADLEGELKTFIETRKNSATGAIKL